MNKVKWASNCAFASWMKMHNYNTDLKLAEKIECSAKGIDFSAFALWFYYSD